MDRPAENTPKAFCALIVSKMYERRDLVTVHEIANTLGISTTTWAKIRDKKWPRLKNASCRQFKACTKTVLRLCTLLELDLEACFVACGLPVPTPRYLAESQYQLVKSQITEAVETIRAKMPEAGKYLEEHIVYDDEALTFRYTGDDRFQLKQILPQ